MKRIEIACYALIASAFVLGGLLVSSLQGKFEPQAQAELVIHRENLTLMTAQTRSSEEALFVMDNVSGKLLIYTLDLGRRRLELAGAADIGALFANAGGAGNTTGGSGNTGRRAR